MNHDARYQEATGKLRSIYSRQCWFMFILFYISSLNWTITSLFNVTRQAAYPRKHDLPHTQDLHRLGSFLPDSLTDNAQEDPCSTAARPSIEANNRKLEGSPSSGCPGMAALVETQGSLWYKTLNIVAIFPLLTYSCWEGPISSVTVFGQTLIILNEARLAIELMEKRSAIHSSRPTAEFIDMWVA